MGAPQPQHPHAHDIDGAKQRLLLAKKWEESIRDTLEIAWRQVEQATRHLESARVQVKEAESSLRTSSSSENNAWDDRAKDGGGGRSKQRGEGGKKNLKGRAFALVAKSLLHKGSSSGGGGSDAKTRAYNNANNNNSDHPRVLRGDNTNSAKAYDADDRDRLEEDAKASTTNKAYADYDHNEESYYEASTSECDVDEDEDEEEHDSEDPSQEDVMAAITQTVAWRRIRNSQRPLSRSVTVTKSPESEELVTLARRGTTGGNKSLLVVSGMDNASRSSRDVVSACGTEDGSRRSSMRRKGGTNNNDNGTKASFRRSNTKGSSNASGAIDLYEEKLERKLEREEEEQEDREAKLRQKFEREGHTKSVKKFKNPELDQLERLARKLDKDKLDRKLEKEDRKSNRRDPARRKRSDGGKPHSNNSLERVAAGSSRRRPSRSTSTAASSNRYDNNNNNNNNNNNSAYDRHVDGSDRGSSPRNKSRSTSRSLEKERGGGSKEDNRKQRGSKRRSGRKGGQNSWSLRPSQSLKESKRKERKSSSSNREDISEQREQLQRTPSRRQPADEGRRRLSRSLKESQTSSDSVLLRGGSSSFKASGGDEMRRLVKEARNLSAGDVDGTESSRRRRRRNTMSSSIAEESPPDSYEGLDRLEILGGRSSSKLRDARGDDLSVSSPQLGAGMDLLGGPRKSKSLVVTSSVPRRETVESHSTRNSSKSTRATSKGRDNIADYRRVSKDSTTDVGRPPSRRELIDESFKSSDEAVVQSGIGEENSNSESDDEDIHRRVTDGCYDLSAPNESPLRRSESSSGREPVVSDQTSPIPRARGSNLAKFRSRNRQCEDEGLAGSGNDLTVSHSMVTEKRAGKGPGRRGGLLSQSIKKLENMLVFDEDPPPP